MLQFVALQDSTAILCRFSLDTIDTGIHIHTVHDGLFKSIVYNDIVIEECFCLWYWRCSQADEFGCIKVFQHFLPVAIDGTVTFINDNQVEEIGGKVIVPDNCTSLVVVSSSSSSLSTISCPVRRENRRCIVEMTTLLSDGTLADFKRFTL